jgi:predicted phage replisome organizer
MAAKKFYWLKLKEDFFSSKEIKKLRRIAGGDTYTIIYLKLMLLSVRAVGRVYFEGVEDTFCEELALEIDEEPDNVKMTLMYLLKMGLLEEVNEAEMMLTQVPEMVGSETDKAALMRKKRARDKVLGNDVTQIGNSVTAVLPGVTERYTDIDIDIEKDTDLDLDTYQEQEPEPQPEPEGKKKTKHIYGEYRHVRLTDDELAKLREQFGVEDTAEAITFLDEYIEMKGYKAKNHYLAIRKWVMDAVKEQRRRRRPNGNFYQTQSGAETSNPFLAMSEEY